MGKTLSVKDDIWDRLNSVKMEMQKQTDIPIHWNDTIEHVLKVYENSNKAMPENPPSPVSPPRGTPKMKGKKHLPKKSPKVKLSAEDLGIPPPPKKKAIKIEVSTGQLKKLSRKETAETKFILIECQICGSKPIMMPVPKHLVLDAKEPVVDVSFIHGEPTHVLVAQLDHDFQVRRRRASWVVYEKDY